MQFNREKFKQLVLYVIWRTSDRQDFGATKLYKALWFAEARANEALGQPIAGETYIRDKFGPRPKHIPEVLDELQGEELISVWSEPFHEYTITRFCAYQPPDTTIFSAEELSLIDWWIKHIDQTHTATSISEKSHDYAWKIAGMGEELPLHAFLASRIREPTEEELSWAKEKATKLGLK